MESIGQIDPVIVWWPCVGTLISVGHDKSYTNAQLERGLRRMPEAWKGVWCCSAPTWPVDYERRRQYLILARMVRGANETAFKPFPAWRRHRYTWGRLGWAFEGNVDRLRRIFPLDRTVAENMAVAPEMNEMSVAVFIYDPGTAPPPPRSQRYGRLRGVQLGSTPARRSTSSWRASWPPERETQTSWNRSWTPAWTSTWAGREGSGHTTCRRTVTGRTGPGRTGGSIRWRSMEDSCADLRGSGAATTTGGPMSVS